MTIQYSPDDPLLKARQAAAELGIGVSTFWRDVQRKRLPLPYYVSKRSPRWRRSEILAILASCPRQPSRTGTGAMGMIAVDPKPE